MWVGWFGFNAGSALAASGLATSAFVATHFGAAAAALGWMLAEWMKTGSRACWAASPARSRAGRDHAGLGFCKPLPALLIGFVAGVVCYLMVTTVKQKFGYDDSLDAFGVHGAGGTLGASSPACSPPTPLTMRLRMRRARLPLGLVDGNAGQIMNQADRRADRLGAGDRRYADHSEDRAMLTDRRAGDAGARDRQGLDLSLHGEEGYTTSKRRRG